MIVNTAHVVSSVVTAVACYLIACRIDKMTSGKTKVGVFLQHFSLGGCMFVSMVMNFTDLEDWSPAVMAGGVLLFFVMSFHRWRNAAPDDTTKPGDLGPLKFNELGRK